MAKHDHLVTPDGAAITRRRKALKLSRAQACEGSGVGLSTWQRAEHSLEISERKLDLLLNHLKALEEQDPWGGAPSVLDAISFAQRVIKDAQRTFGLVPERIVVTRDGDEIEMDFSGPGYSITTRTTPDQAVGMFNQAIIDYREAWGLAAKEGRHDAASETTRPAPMESSDFDGA